MKALGKMMKSAGSPTCNPQAGITVLRIGIGIVFLLAGISKLVTLEVTTFMFTQIGLATYWVYVVSILETVGGLFLVLGLWTRYSAIVLGVIMLVATVIQFRFGGGVMGAMAPFVILLAMIQMYITGSTCWSLEKKLFCKNMSSSHGGQKKYCACSGTVDCSCGSNCESCKC